MFTPAKVFFYAQALTSITGSALAIAAALSAWVAVSAASASRTFSFFGIVDTAGGATVNTAVTPTSQYAAAAAMLLLGFILGLFHCANTVYPRGLQHPYPIILSALAFVCTFIGTIVGAGVRAFALLVRQHF
jgi:hypothetical protein